MGTPYKITNKSNNLVADISKLLGQFTAYQLPPLKLRKKNRIKTIKSTLAIEGHRFTEEQVTAVFEKNKVIGNKREILEVRNAIKLYDCMDQLKSKRVKDFLYAHKVLMKNLIKSAGKYRSKNVGVLDGTKIKHLAPKPKLVPELMTKAFQWIKVEKTLHPLILSSIVHYEIEFIHPFEDGNGRMGRFWQGLILKKYDSLFKYVPIENLIEKNQKQYYVALEKSDKAGESTLFIEFMLKIIKEALEEMSADFIGIVDSYQSRIERAQEYFTGQFFTRKEYCQLFKMISSATASRDLKRGVSEDYLKKYGEKNQTQYKFLKRKI